MSVTKVTKQIDVGNGNFRLSYDSHWGCFDLEIGYHDGSVENVMIEENSLEDFIHFCDVVANGGIEV